MKNLSEKEKELIRLKAQGLRIGDIAKIVIMSRRSTEVALHRLYEKVGVNNGSQLVHWGYQNGILEINAENLTAHPEKGK
jgi:DNA-binding CsgD family transcriptional regulator